MNFFNKLERKYGKYAIKNLMFYIIILYIIGWIVQIINPAFYSGVLSLNVSKILQGEVWRLFTFIIMPPQDSSPIFMIFTLYLYYILGINLEKVWGSFKFNVYFFMGIFFHIIAAFIIYFVFGISMPLTTYYLNMSLFFAFAMVYPDMQLLLFFIIPIKIKWIAILDGLYFGATIIFGFFFESFPITVQERLLSPLLNLGIIPLKPIAVAAFVSLLNFIVFFIMTRNFKRMSPKEVYRRTNYKKQVHKYHASGAMHKCEICGRNSDQYPDLTFRYCSKCKGNHEYCQEHLFTHEHVK